MTDAGLTEEDARSRFYLVDRQGLLTEGMKGLQPFQAIFAQRRERAVGWTLSSGGPIGLPEVVANARPTALIGTSGQAHAFTEAVVRALAQNTQRPIIFPLSNPTERSEATPQDLLAWTEDRAVVGTGSPFPPIIRGGHPFRIDQVNNAYVFPGVGLAAIAIEARRISEGMFLAAARAIADLSPAKRDPHANLLPPLAELRTIALQVAIAVAEQAAREGLAGRLPKDDLAIAVKSKMWEPIYSTYQRLLPPQRG